MYNEMKFNEDVAVMCGLREAVLATYLWELIAKDDDAIYRFGRLWTRISQRNLSVQLPFMSIDMISRAAKKLERDGIIVIYEFNNSRFDRTHSYAFTEFGSDLMGDVYG